VAEGVIRMVVRAFYDDEVVVVMDGLLMLTDARRNTVSSMREQDLATELKLQHTFVRRCLAQLEKDCLVRSREVKETHGNREQNHQYWWVDHKQALDAIKLRMRRMRKKLEQEPAERKTEYVCETCVDDEDRHPSWDEFEVQELPVPFECPHCQQDLEEKVQSMDDGGGSNDISKRLEKQLRPINDEISKTEEMTLPAPRANTAASRGAAKVGEPGHVPGGGGPGADQGPQAKKIVVSLEGLQGKPAWQMQPSAAAAGSGTAAAATSTGLWPSSLAPTLPTAQAPSQLLSLFLSVSCSVSFSLSPCHSFSILLGLLTRYRPASCARVPLSLWCAQPDSGRSRHWCASLKVRLTRVLPLQVLLCVRWGARVFKITYPCHLACMHAWCTHTHTHTREQTHTDTDTNTHAHTYTAALILASIKAARVRFTSEQQFRNNAFEES
jgi:transcription initiation factor IIE alpha subunit